jgi:hypothetical protein
MRYGWIMTQSAIGYARCSTDKQNLTVQRKSLLNVHGGDKAGQWIVGGVPMSVDRRAKGALLAG